MEEPKYPLFKDRSITVWGQLADHLQYRLDSFEFRDRMPPFNTFATEYGVTSSTVNRAIRDLKERGVLTELPNRDGLYPTGREYWWRLNRYFWRDIASNVYAECPRAMSLLSYGAPRSWRDGFWSDIWRYEEGNPSLTPISEFDRTWRK